MTAFEDFKGAASSPAGTAIIGGAGGLMASKLQSRYAKEAALVANQFSERMSNTAMQRRAIDLEAAGMNKMLAVGGPGAAAPTGQMAQVPDIARGVMGGISGALQVSKLKKEKDLLSAQAGAARTSAKLNETENRIKEMTEPRWRVTEEIFLEVLNHVKSGMPQLKETLGKVLGIFAPDRNVTSAGGLNAMATQSGSNMGRTPLSAAQRRKMKYPGKKGFGKRSSAASDLRGVPFR